MIITVKIPGSAEIVYTGALYNGSSLTNQLGIYDGKHYVIKTQISKSFFDASDLAKPFTFTGRWPVPMIQFLLTLPHPAVYLHQAYYLCWLSE
jgi:hypothetical protein